MSLNNIQYGGGRTAMNRDQIAAYSHIAGIFFSDSDRGDIKGIQVTCKRIANMNKDANLVVLYDNNRDTGAVVLTIPR